MPNLDVDNARVTFSQLYKGTEENLAKGGVKGWTKLWGSSKSYGQTELTTHHAMRWSSGSGLGHAAAVVRDSIQNEYGREVADRACRNVFGTDDRLSSITLDQLKGLKNALKFERTKAEQRGRQRRPSQQATTFSDIESYVKQQGTALSEDKHLRFRGTKGLYFHKSKSMFPIRRLWAKSPATKREAAGAKIWKALANEFDEATANRIFQNVLGVKASSTGKPPEVAVTLKQFKQLSTEKEKEAKVFKALQEARALVRSGADPKAAGSAKELGQRAILGSTFNDDDPAKVKQDLSDLRKDPRFARLSLPEIALELESLDIDGDEHLSKVPPDLHAKMKSRLASLKEQVAEELTHPTSEERSKWDKRVESMTNEMCKPDVPPAQFKQNVDTLLSAISSNADLKMRSRALNGLKWAIGRVSSKDEQIQRSIPDTSLRIKQLYPDLRREVDEANYRVQAVEIAREDDRNERARGSRGLKPMWSAIEAPEQDIDGAGHHYRARPGSSKFQAPPKISKFASNLQRDKGPVADALDELREHLQAHGNAKDREVIYDPSDNNKVKPLTWENFNYVWDKKFKNIWNDPGYRDFGTAYQMRRCMEDVLKQKTPSERAHALASFVMNAATCEYGVEQGILNKYTRDVMGQTNLSEDEVEEVGNKEKYQGGIERALQKKRMELFAGDQVSTHILGDRIMQNPRTDPVHQRTFLLNAIGNHVGVQPDNAFEHDKYAAVTNPQLARMPQHEMLNHFHALYTPKEMVKTTKDHINSLLAVPDQKDRNKEFGRLYSTFFAKDPDAEECLKYREGDNGQTNYELTDLGAAKILEQMGHLERVDPAPDQAVPQYRELDE